MSLKLGHISDIHIFAMNQFGVRRFLNKRLVGGANLAFKRGKSHSSTSVDIAIQRIHELGCEHLAVSGDLTNLALDEEFVAAREILERFPDANQRVSVVPGNHDYYTPDTAWRQPLERVFSDWMESDLPSYQLDRGYPYCKLLSDDVALIGLNSAHPSPPFFAIGTVAAPELRSAEALLDDPKVRDRFKIVMLHHHVLPFEHSRVEYTRRLTNAEEVLSMLRWRNVDLVIHGHNHHFHSLDLPWLGKPGKMRICEAGSTSQIGKSNPLRGGKFNVYHIEDGVLRTIETHLFDADVSGFRPWREQVIEEQLV